MFVKPQPKEPHRTNHIELYHVLNQSELTRGKARDLCDVGENMQQLVRSTGKICNEVT